MAANDIRRDIFLGMRALRRNPLFTTVTILTLALGIGATTAMFSILDTVLLRPLPFEEPDRLVVGRKSFDGGRTSNGPVSGYDWYDCRQQSRSFEHLAMMTWGPFRTTVTGGEEPERVSLLFVSWDLFPALKVAPVIGRLFDEREAVVGAPSVVLLSHGYWQRRFGGDRGVIGKSLIARGQPYTIIGVMPAGFRFLADTDLWSLTYRDGPAANARRWHNLLVVGRLKPGVAIGQAQQELDVISADLAALHPDSNRGKSLLLTNLRDYMVEDARTSLMLLMATVVLVLLIACSNVAGLLLARGQSRLSEIAIRSSLGASRLRLIRQLLLESMILAVAAGVAGIFFAAAFMRLILRLLPAGRFGSLEPSLDVRVLGFTLLVSLATGLIFGLVPAFRNTAVRLTSRLGSGTRTSEDRSGSRWRASMVAFQVALSIVLLIGSALLIRSLGRQAGSDLGFRFENLLVAEVQLPPNDYPEPARRLAFFRSLSQEVGALPFVESATLINQLPIRDPGNDIYAWPAGEEPASAEETRTAYDRIVVPGYFGLMGIPLALGRDLAETDTANSPPVVVISESLARDLFPGSNPVGRLLVIDLGEKVTHEVVGVVADVRMTSVRSDPYRTMYTSYLQRPQSGMRLIVRTAGDPGSLVPSVRQVLRSLDRNVPLAEPSSMADVIDRSIAPFRTVTLSLGLFSAVAALLTAIGLYGVLAFWVHQHSYELGIRMALGATGAHTTAFIIKRGFLLAGIGLVPGILAAGLGARMIRQLLFEVEPLDPASYAAAGLFLLAITALACLLPAMRARRIDPARALRAE